MKLKKLLAAVTAAALAVTTMAVTSFTASAESLSSAPRGTETVLYTVNLSGVKTVFTSKYDDGDWTQVVIDEGDRATIMTDPEVYVKATMSDMKGIDGQTATYDEIMAWGWDGYSWIDGLKWYNNSGDGADFECNFIPIEGSTSAKSIAYAPISDLKMYDWGGIAGNLQSGHITGLTLDKLEIVRVTEVVDTTVYADQVLELPAFEGGTLKFEGTFDPSKVSGSNAYIEVKWTSSEDNNGMKLMKAEDYETVVAQKKGSGVGAQTTKFMLSDITILEKMWVNGWGVASIESVTIHNDATKGDVYTAGSDTPAPTLTMTPNTLTVAKDDTADITITAANADGYTFTAASSDDTKATATLNGTTVTVEGKAAGTATITVTGTKSGADDITATCAVTVTDSATPPDPGHTHTPADTWTSDATGHWHACSGCTDKVDFAAHTFDSGEITTPPTETTTGVKTYKCTVCEYTKTETIPATGTNPPSHTHTAVSGWSSDSANHWHVCSECGEKFDSAAHTSDSGTVTVPATETTTGIRTYKCTVCGYVMRTETIPATGTTPEPSVPSGNQGYTGGVVIPFINNSGVARNTPVISDDNTKSGWDAIASEITASGSGSTISVDMNGATKVPSSIFREIEGLDIDLVLNMGRGIKWTVNGLSVTSHKNIDFGVSKNTKHIPNDVVSTVDGTYKRQISLDHNGTFGCTASMTIDIGTRYDGLYANLFYYNPKTEALEFADCSLVSGGNAKFVFTHASDYVITVTAEPLGEFEDVSSAAGISSESSSVNSVAPVAVLAAIVLGFGIVVYRKRRHN